MTRSSSPPAGMDSRAYRLAWPGHVRLLRGGPAGRAGLQGRRARRRRRRAVDHGTVAVDLRRRRLGRPACRRRLRPGRAVDLAARRAALLHPRAGRCTAMLERRRAVTAPGSLHRRRHRQRRGAAPCPTCGGCSTCSPGGAARGCSAATSPEALFAAHGFEVDRGPARRARRRLRPLAGPRPAAAGHGRAAGVLRPRQADSDDRSGRSSSSAAAWPASPPRSRWPARPPGHGARRGAGPPPEGPAGEAAQLWDRPTVPQALHAHTFTRSASRSLRDRAAAGVRRRRSERGRARSISRDAAAHRCRSPTATRNWSPSPAGATSRAVLHRVVRPLPGVEVRHRRPGARPAARRRRGGGSPASSSTGGERIAADAGAGRHRPARESRPGWPPPGIRLRRDQIDAHQHPLLHPLLPHAAPGLPGALTAATRPAASRDTTRRVVHPGDNDTFSIRSVVHAEDPALRALRHAGGVHRGRRDRRRTSPLARRRADDRRSARVRHHHARPTCCGRSPPPSRAVAGLFPVGDAACVTNPLFGRGMSLAIAHAFRLADAARRRTPRSARRRASGPPARRPTLLAPWYQRAVARRHGADRALAGGGHGTRAGRPGPAVSSSAHGRPGRHAPTRPCGAASPGADGSANRRGGVRRPRHRRPGARRPATDARRRADPRRPAAAVERPEHRRPERSAPGR